MNNNIYKASLTISRTGNAKHNDREQNITDGHVDPSKSNKNLYWSWNGQGFYASERSFYYDRYKDWLNHKNSIYINNRHKEKCITMNQLLTAQRTKPQEMILQVGNNRNHIQEKDLEKCLLDFLNVMDSYKENVHILNWALHADEATPHIHIRYVMDYTDKDGYAHISQRQALHCLGFDAPIQEIPDTMRYNNPSVTFTSELRDRWYNICEQNGIHIDRSVDRTTVQQHYQILQYKVNQLQKDELALRMKTEQRTLELSSLEERIQEMNEENKRLQEEIHDKESDILDLQKTRDDLMELVRQMEQERQEEEKKEIERKKRHTERKAREAEEAKNLFASQ